MVNASGALFSRQAALSVPDEFTTYKGCGDWLFWIELAHRGGVAVVPEALNFFRQHEENTTSLLKKNGSRLLESKKLSDTLLGKGYISLIDFLKIKIYSIATAKYGCDLPDETKNEILKTWGDNFFWSFLSVIKNTLFKK